MPDSSHAPENLSKVLDRYKENGITINQAYIESDPTDALFDEMKRRNIRVFMWTHSVLERYGKNPLNYSDYRVKKLSDPKTDMPYNYIDFTSQKSKDAIYNKFGQIWDKGVCGEMVDFADSMPEDAICSNGKTGIEMHNGYSYWYARRMNEAFSEYIGDDFMLFQRSGAAGNAHYTASFGGDIVSSFLGLRRSLYQLLSCSASGISIWGSDLGGFCMPPKDIADKTDYLDLYKRWTQFATFTPLMRDHSWSCNHNPWDNGDEGLENFKKYYAIRISLLDKIYSRAVETSKNGGTVVTSIQMEYGLPSDTEYLFCNDILVRPITEQGIDSVEVEFPENGFVGLFDGETYNKGKSVVDCGGDIPAFIRQGSVIPLRLDSGLLPTLDKENYIRALLLTAPDEARENIVYTDKNNCFTAITQKTQGGFKVSLDKAVNYENIIICGKKATGVKINGKNAEFSFDAELNRTIVKNTNSVNLIEVE